MKVHRGRSAVLIAICIYWLIPQAFVFSQTAKDQPSHGRLSRVFSSFEERPVSPLKLENSPRVETLILDGKLELTLADALALAVENNLDIAVQRFIPQFSQTDVTRSESGQSPRGFTGSTIPGGLTAGAIGAGISGTGAGSGVGSAGGITGGGGAVQVGAAGNFDPTFSLNFSFDRTTSPLNTTTVSGVPNVTGNTTAFTASYAQLFPTGISYSLTLNGQRQTSNQQSLLFNPAQVTRFAVGVNQPLMSGFGRTANERYIIVARNNTKVSEWVFRLQVITTVVAIENAYWNLAALQQQVKVAERTLAVSQQLLKDNQVRLEVGIMSPLDVTSAESEVAGATRDLTLASTNVLMQEATLKNMLVKKVGPELDAARIVIKDPMPEPVDNDIPDLEMALAGALETRPELRQTEIDIANQILTVNFTENALKPALAVFGFFAGSGLLGSPTSNPTQNSGMMDAFGQSFRAAYPEYSTGMTLSIPIRNRSAQADNIRSQLERDQLGITRQRTRNTVTLEVRKAIIGLIQGKAQVEAAHKAASLASEIYEGEKQKLEAGASTSYNVILRERDLATAQQAEVAAVANYANALVEMDRARGATLDRNGIEYSDALSGTVSRQPVPPFSIRGSNKGGK